MTWVPAEPGPWRRQLGGNALYAAAGARLVLPDDEIAVVSRIGSGLDAAIEDELQARGLRTAMTRRPEPHLIEWLLYDANGARRAIPKGERFHLKQDAEAERATYFAALEAISPSPEDVPDAWRAAKAFHLAPQIWKRHAEHLNAIPSNALISLDPSPHYAKDWDIDMFVGQDRDGLLFLPSEQELAGLARFAEPGSALALAQSLVVRLVGRAVVKLGAEGALFFRDGLRHAKAATASPQDPTGAGDGFCGAFAAARALAWPLDACVEAAIVAGAMMVETRGVAQALALDRSAFTERLNRYKAGLEVNFDVDFHAELTRDNA